MCFFRARSSDADTAISGPVKRWDDSNIEQMVPADSFDFTGLKLDPKNAREWHYVRTADSTPDKAWKCVYPGKYTMGDTGPRGEGVHTTSWDPDPAATPVAKSPWDAGGDPATPITLGSTNAASSYRNTYPGIRLNNFDWADSINPSNKVQQAGNKNRYPFGGFARLGDILQVPFIGAYAIFDGTTLVEMNPITMDSIFADDQDTADDGRPVFKGAHSLLALRLASGKPAADDGQDGLHHVRSVFCQPTR